MMKQIMIPVAAFAVTVTGASAFNADLLEKIDVDLTDTQIEVLEEVHELRVDGVDRDEIKDKLEDAGLDQDTMNEIREATRSYRGEMREMVHAALADGDYDAYLDAVEGSPRADLVDSEDAFELLMEAHELREAGDHEGAQEIMEGLGFEKPGYGDGEGRGEGKGGMRGGHGPSGEGDGEGRGFGGPRGDREEA